MGFDLSKFQQAFFEECAENLDCMESALLGLSPEKDNTEAIHTIFRGAHSIKGGAATFAYQEIASFTHTMESLLDRIREGRRPLQPADVDLLLRCVDAVREMLVARREGGAYDATRVATLEAQLKEGFDPVGTGIDSQTPARVVPPSGADRGPQDAARDADEISEEEFEALLDQLHGPGMAPGIARQGVDGTAGPCAHDKYVGNELGRAESGAKREPEGRGERWHIAFRPHAGMLMGGNDPTRIFLELESLGELKVTPDLGALPGFDTMDPEACYLAWMLQLRTSAGRERIAEAFAWVEGECDLAISLVDQQEAPAQSRIPHTSTARAEPPTEAPRATSPVASAEAPVVAVPDPGRPVAGGESASIKVAIDKIDALINMVGELVITQSMLAQISDDFDIEDLPRLKAGLVQLERNTRELQDSVMRIRMLPIGFAFNRLPRLVRDLSAKLGKKVELKLTGEHTELDKTVLDRIGDPLLHLVRNALDHGIEKPETRSARGKPEFGTLHLHAYHQSGNIVIEVADDGCGLSKDRIIAKAKARGLIKNEGGLTDSQIYELIFLPGFSTTDEVSEVSGRGVGMDVVRRNVKALGGSVEIRSQEGQGTTVTIRLPLTLAIVGGQTVCVGGEIYIVPLMSVVEMVRLSAQQVSVVAGGAEVVHLRDEYLPLLRLYEILGAVSRTRDLEQGLLVVVEAGGRKAGLFVDELLGQQQVVIKSLEANFMRVAGIAGATIFGDGTVALILDVPELIRLAQSTPRNPHAAMGAPGAFADIPFDVPHRERRYEEARL